ncbi:MAG: hopanoid-associated sugar epimerase [Gammaproteobacteria bacterium]
MTTLLTGATGFVGSAVLRALVDAGHRVRALVRPASDRRNLAGVTAEMVEGDLGDRRSLERAVTGCRYLFHVAADYRLWARDPAEIYARNTRGTRILMETALAAGVERIVYTSSVATLGLHADGRPADESTPVTLEDMIGPYKRSKFMAEEGVRRLVREQELPAVIVNPSTPIGPRDVKPTPTGKMIVDAARGRMPAYVDTGLNIVHVDDVARGHLLAFERGRIGERYVLGGENLSLREILAVIAELAGRRPPRIKLSPSVVLPIAYACEAWATVTGRGEPLVVADAVRMARKKMFFTSAMAQRDLGYTFRPPRQALRDAYTWFRDAAYLGRGA